MTARDFVRNLGRLEESELECQINLASSLRQAKTVAANSSVIRSLARQMRSDRKLVTLLVARIGEYCDRAVDIRYESPWDVPMFASLVALDGVRPDLARVLAPSVLRAPNTTWAAALSRDLLSEVSTVNSEDVHALANGPSDQRSSVFVSTTLSQSVTPVVDVLQFGVLAPDAFSVNAVGSSVVQWSEFSTGIKTSVTKSTRSDCAIPTEGVLDAAA